MQASDAEELCVDCFDAVWQAGFRSGDFSTTETLFASARAFARTHNNVAFKATVLDGLGMLAHYRHITTMLSGEIIVDDDVAAEEDLFQEALSLH